MDINTMWRVLYVEITEDVTKFSVSNREATIDEKKAFLADKICVRTTKFNSSRIRIQNVRLWLEVSRAWGNTDDALARLTTVPDNQIVTLFMRKFYANPTRGSVSKPFLPNAFIKRLLKARKNIYGNAIISISWELETPKNAVA